MGGFSKRLGRTSVYIAELWGVFEGLLLTRSKNINKLVMQVYSIAVVKSISINSTGNATGWRLIVEIKKLLQLDWQVSIVHVYREGML